MEMYQGGLRRPSKTLSPLGQKHRATLQAVRISVDLIAFYPEEIHRPQPYVILLDQASGILRRVDLHATK
jgi:hypothetical protein